MKTIRYAALIIFTAVISLVCARMVFARTVVLQINSPTITIDGVSKPLDTDGTVPILYNGQSYVPFRALFNALGADVAWDEKSGTAVALKDDVTIKLTINQETAYINDMGYTLPNPPILYNSKTLVPLRFVSAGLGYGVGWDGKTGTITIYDQTEPSGVFLSLSQDTIYLNESLSSVETKLGKAQRIDESLWGFSWHVFNKDYTRFMMVGIKDDEVVALYSNAKGFSTNGVKYGDIGSKDAKNTTNKVYYIDSLDKKKVVAVLLLADGISYNKRGSDAYSDGVLRAQEMEIFDLTNTFRVNNGLNPLKADDEIAFLTARVHSQDMADNNYFNHKNLSGLSPFDRYYKNGGKNFGSGENIAAGHISGLETFNQWLNSKGHRENMLADHDYLGVGLGYNGNSTYRYYSTQFFSKKQ